ncbi:hypothetical protein PHMEG_0002333 [Phytophthora megakarya]|uniref:MULE transposase domain-containing protein n=1 Tax=Phytophthora megakarya TaxID=4795 RepID=A0A225X0X1_9STRA|nr:hypothetical protein PHMEG_0002333 [Phytophthora megakarya]
MDRSPESFIFHLDTTFKLSQVDYTTFVCVFNNASVTKTNLQPSNEKVLIVCYVMGDADKAQVNAVHQNFCDGDVVYLMCFWHMITKLYEHGQSLSSIKLALAAADVFDMHYALSESRFHARKTLAECVCICILQQPVETFNAMIKQVYTFLDKPIGTTKIKKRAHELRRMELLFEAPSLDDSSQVCSDINFVLVQSRATSRIFFKPRKKNVDVIDICTQMGTNSARMERDE